MEYFFGRMNPRRLKVLHMTSIEHVIKRVDNQHLDICFSLGSPITWSSKWQLIVAISCIEVEYRSLAERLKESTSQLNWGFQKRQKRFGATI
jgi:hypothetical protein